jgi:hypothetical protein
MLKHLPDLLCGFVAAIAVIRYVPFQWLEVLRVKPQKQLTEMDWARLHEIAARPEER